ncbi:hypothetical protein [Oleiagrimonas sp. C23AA]|uniref:hypothetical protein n=1 Tax=Oleiagrimonas sp. C23AA TaxID=2719047 RepID=UPI0014220D34|nr:hypothetical protein [Oleiagrimonas sp. C23AA]NII10554.1 hypothetical protein [Oleiagrimonas sp. C23AA]
MNGRLRETWRWQRGLDAARWVLIVVNVLFLAWPLSSAGIGVQVGYLAGLGALLILLRRLRPHMRAQVALLALLFIYPVVILAALRHDAGLLVFAAGLIAPVLIAVALAMLAARHPPP